MEISNLTIKRIVLIFSIPACLLILLDAYVSPYQKKIEVADGFGRYFGRSGKGTPTYTVRTKINIRYEIPEDLFYELKDGDTLSIYKSQLTSAAKIIEFKRQGQIFSSKIGYVNGQRGLLFISITIILMGVFVIFVDRISIKRVKSVLFGLSIFLTIIFWLFHLNIAFWFGGR